MRIHGWEVATRCCTAWRRSRRTLLALGGAAVVAAAAPAGQALAAAPARGDIAFTSNAPAPGQTGKGEFRINVMNTDGVGVALNPNPSGQYQDVDPAWSPDGRKIAFASNRPDGGNYDIYVMNADGTGVTQVTSAPGDERYPAWSPNGGLLAFRGDASATSRAYEIFTVRADGTGLAPVHGTYGGEQPAWAPDGQRIVFADTDVTPGPVLKIVDLTGDAPVQVTSGPDAADRYPAWSPDGSQIAFRRVDTSGLGREVWTVSLATGGLTNLSEPGILGAPARAASWSPDGRSMTFVSYRDADRNQEIWLGSVDGKTQPARQLTFTTWDNEEPRWADVPADAAPVPPATGTPSPGTVGGGVVTGTRRVALSLSMRIPRQRLGKRRWVRALLRCNLTCQVAVSGSLNAHGHAKAVRLRIARRALVAGRWARLNVPVGSRALRTIRTSLRHHRRVRVSLTATARSTSGAFTPAAIRFLTLKR